MIKQDILHTGFWDGGFETARRIAFDASQQLRIERDPVMPFMIHVERLSTLMNAWKYVQDSVKNEAH